MTGVLTVRVVHDRPRLAYVYGKNPNLYDVLASKHDITARVLRVSKGRKWDVVAVHGVDERGHVYGGCELSLDGSSYDAKREGEVLLGQVAAAMEAMG